MNWISLTLIAMLLTLVTPALAQDNCTDGKNTRGAIKCLENKLRNNSPILQVVTKPMKSNLTTATSNDWSDDLATITVKPHSSTSKLLVSLSGTINLVNSGADPHRAGHIAIFVGKDKVAGTGADFGNAGKVWRQIPFYLEGEYTQLSNAQSSDSVTFAIRIWQRGDTKATVQFIRDGQVEPGLFKVIELVDQE